MKFIITDELRNSLNGNPYLYIGGVQDSWKIGNDFNTIKSEIVKNSFNQYGLPDMSHYLTDGKVDRIAYSFDINMRVNLFHEDKGIDGSEVIMTYATATGIELKEA